MMNRITRAAMIFAAALCCIAFATPAKAVREAALEGHWVGFGQSAVTPSPGGPIPIPYPVAADITPKQNRKFLIGLLLPAVQKPLTIEGTVAENGNLSIEGREGKQHFDAHGKVREMGDGSVRVVALKYDFTYLICDGLRHDNGFLILLQMQGGPNWNNTGRVNVAIGDWSGDYKSSGKPGGGGMKLQLVKQPSGGITNGGNLSTAFAGYLHMDGVLLPNVKNPQNLIFSRALGTIGEQSPPNPARPAAAPFALIGLTEPPDPDRTGIIAILIGLLRDPNPKSGSRLLLEDHAIQCHGTYRLDASFNDVFTEISKGGSTAFGQGTFSMKKK